MNSDAATLFLLQNSSNDTRNRSSPSYNSITQTATERSKIKRWASGCVLCFSRSKTRFVQIVELRQRTAGRPTSWRPIPSVGWKIPIHRFEGNQTRRFPSLLPPIENRIVGIVTIQLDTACLLNPAPIQRGTIQDRSCSIHYFAAAVWLIFWYRAVHGHRKGGNSSIRTRCVCRRRTSFVVVKEVGRHNERLVGRRRMDGIFFSTIRKWQPDTVLASFLRQRASEDDPSPVWNPCIDRIG